MSKKESHVSYRFEGPVSFSSMTAQAFLRFGFQHAKAEQADWIFQVTGDAGQWEASLFRREGSDRRSRICRSRREAGHFLMDQLAEISERTPGSWGYLLGMRPSKALYPFLKKENWRELAEQFLTEENVSGDVRKLLLQAAACEKRLDENARFPLGETVSLYVHVPFCPSHCAYCSFPTEIAPSAERLRLYADAVCEDIRNAGRLIRRKNFFVESLYFGGGTPTILPEEQMERILEAVRENIPLNGEPEWTVEAGRPDTITGRMLTLLRKYGVNRISVNPQTMQDRILEKISRTHHAEDIIQAFEETKRHGFLSVNMDFICGLPTQTAGDMEENLRVICQLRPENVTIHTLAIKRGSPFLGREKELCLPEEKQVEAMLQMTQRVLAETGYHPYYLYRQKYMTDDFANVGYALRGFDSVYNIRMISEHQHVIGVGAGAVSKALRPGGFQLKKLYMPRQAELYRRNLQYLCKERDALWDVSDNQ